MIGGREVCRVGCTHVAHECSRITAVPPTMSGRSTSGFHRPGAGGGYCLSTRGAGRRQLGGGIPYRNHTSWGVERSATAPGRKLISGRSVSFTKCARCALISGLGVADGLF